MGVIKIFFLRGARGAEQMNTPNGGQSAPSAYIKQLFTSNKMFTPLLLIIRLINHPLPLCNYNKCGQTTRLTVYIIWRT